MYAALPDNLLHFRVTLVDHLYTMSMTGFTLWLALCHLVRQLAARWDTLLSSPGSPTTWTGFSQPLVSPLLIDIRFVMQNKITAHFSTPWFSNFFMVHSLHHITFSSVNAYISMCLISIIYINKRNLKLNKNFHTHNTKDLFILSPRTSPNSEFFWFL